MNELADGPLQARQPSVRFAGFTLDFDGCALTAADGSPVTLTRSEFSLLREFVRKRGRVLSREHLLDALAGKRTDPFDRSIDMLVARLRRKVEPEPKQPTLIVTVPGEGYKFVAPVTQADASLPAEAGAPTIETPKIGTATTPLQRRRVPLAALIAFACLAAMFAWWQWPRAGPTAEPPRIAVLPFANLSGDASQDYFSAGVTGEVVTMLATSAGLRVVPTSGLSEAKDVSLADAARLTGARYALRGGVVKSDQSMRITAQLFDTATGEALWADRFDGSGANPLAVQADLADRIFQTIAGTRGKVSELEAQAAWRKSAPSLGEYDYYARGIILFHQLTSPEVLRARDIWREGLDRFPDSTLLRIKLAWTYLVPVTSYYSKDPRGDIEQAWRIATEVKSNQDGWRGWFQHWMMAFLYQFHERDYGRSVAEARAAVQMVPYDGFSKIDLSWVLANAGKLDEAIEWAQFSIRHEPNGPSWYFFNLAWAYYLAGRHDDVAALAREHAADFPLVSAVSLARSGHLAEARTAMAAWRAMVPADTVAAEAYFPLVEPYRTRFIEDLRAVGLPES